MSDGFFASVFLLAVQLPAKASDGLSPSVFLFLFRLFRMSSFSTQAICLLRNFSQRRDICDIFASRQGSLCSSFLPFFAEMTFLAGHAGGPEMTFLAGHAPPSGGLHRAGLILSHKKAV